MGCKPVRSTVDRRRRDFSVFASLNDPYRRYAAIGYKNLSDFFVHYGFADLNNCEVLVLKPDYRKPWLQEIPACGNIIIFCNSANTGGINWLLRLLAF